MRRVLSVFLILLFGAGPLAMALTPGAESRLPACCRRLGAHHCAMSAEMAARVAQVSTESGPLFTAPSHCPNFPGTQAASPTPIYALAAKATGLPVLLAQAHSPAASRAAARLSQIRTRAGRGPPSSSLA